MIVLMRKIIINKKTTNYIALGLIAVLAVSLMEQILPAYAALCPSGNNFRCHEVHRYLPFFSVNGLQTTNFVRYTTGTAGWIASSNWVHLVDGNFIEMLWQDSVTDTAKPHLAYGKNGGVTQSWNCTTSPSFCPNDNSSITTTIDDLNTDLTWTFNAAGITATLTMATSWTNKIETGYEHTHDGEINVRMNDYNNLKYGRGDLTPQWNPWNSFDGNHEKVVTLPLSYYVKFCADSPFTHSQHGKNTDPATCA